MSSGIRILLLEDDLDLRTALESALELEDYQVFAAADGAEALSKAEGNPFDILVFDIKLPGPDGLEVLAQFKKENPDLLSVVMTGYATEKDTLRALRLGVGDYLKKPFRLDVLLNAVKRLDREVRRRRALEVRERATNKAFLWLAEFLVGGLDINHELKGLSLTDSARAARKFASALGHAEDVADTLQLALLLAYLRDYGESDSRLSELESMLPESAMGLLTAINEIDPPENPDSLAALGALSKSLIESPQKLEELERKFGVSLKDEHPSTKRREKRQLLSLARAFAASGDKASAREACLRLVEYPRSSEAGFAHLELAKLAWAEGDSGQANKSLRQVLNLLPQLGPQRGAELELEAGLSALGMGLKDGRHLLQRTLPQLERMGLADAKALAILSLRATSDEPRPLSEDEQAALREIVHQDLTSTFLGHSRWMLPYLLRLQIEVNEPYLARLLAQIAQDAPRSVSRTLVSDLPEDQLLLLLDAIENSGGSTLIPSLQAVFTKVESDRVRNRIERVVSGLTHQETSTVRLYSLGAFEVWIGDLRLPETAWRTSRSRFLLAQLAARMNRPVLAEVLTEQLWPGVRASSGKKNVSQAVSDLRKVMDEAGYDRADDLVVRKHDLISLNTELPIWHDVAAFGEGFTKGKEALAQGEVREAHQQLRRSYALLRGEYLEDCPMDWVLPQRREHERAAMECCELLAQSCQTLGLYPEVIEVANRALERDPCHQVLHRLIMEAYVGSGRPESALRQFEEATVILQEELGVEPSTDLLRAQQVARMSL